MKDAPINLPPLPKGLEGALQSLPPHVAREIRGYLNEHAHAAVLADRAGRDRRIAELEEHLTQAIMGRQFHYERAEKAEAALRTNSEK